MCKRHTKPQTRQDSHREPQQPDKTRKDTVANLMCITKYIKKEIFSKIGKKKHITHKEKPTRITANSSIETLKPRVT